MSEETKMIRHKVADLCELNNGARASIIAALDRLEAREEEKTVPMDMLRDIYNYPGAPISQGGAFKHIAARYGYKVME